MKATIVVLAAALAVCGCSAQAARDPARAVPATSAATSAGVSVMDLDGTDWRFIEVAGRAVPADVTATMRFKDGRISGKAGCNAYGASYSIKPDGSAHFQQGMSTKMACLTPPGAMQVEHGVFAALRTATKAEIRDGRLLLLDSAGKSMAELTKSNTE